MAKERRCDHDYDEHRIGAGLLRRVCRRCDHLEIDQVPEPYPGHRRLGDLLARRLASESG